MRNWICFFCVSTALGFDLKSPEWKVQDAWEYRSSRISFVDYQQPDGTYQRIDSDIRYGVTVIQMARREDSTDITLKVQRDSVIHGGSRDGQIIKGQPFSKEITVHTTSGHAPSSGLESMQEFLPDLIFNLEWSSPDSSTHQDRPSVNGQNPLLLASQYSSTLTSTFGKYAAASGIGWVYRESGTYGFPAISVSIWELLSYQGQPIDAKSLYNHAIQIPVKVVQDRGRRRASALSGRVPNRYTLDGRFTPTLKPTARR